MILSNTKVRNSSHDYPSMHKLSTMETTKQKRKKALTTLLIINQSNVSNEDDLEIIVICKLHRKPFSVY